MKLDFAWTRPQLVHLLAHDSDAFCRTTGYAADELLGRSLHRLGGPESDPAALTRLRAALDAGTPLRLELRNHRQDGTAYWADISLVPVRGPSGAVSHWVMIQRDATDRKRIEGELRRSEERLRMVGDSLPDGAIYQMVMGADNRGRCTYVSAGIEYNFARINVGDRNQAVTPGFVTPETVTNAHADIQTVWARLNFRLSPLVGKY